MNALRITTILRRTPQGQAPKPCRNQLLFALKICAAASGALVVALTGTTSTVLADESQQGVYNQGIGFFNVSNCQANPQTGYAITLFGSDNIEKAYNFLIGQGLSPTATAAIIGNLYEESGIDPKIVEASPPYDSDTMPDSIRGNHGYGIAQWTNYDRQQNLLNFAQKAGKPESDLGVQLGYLWVEATTTYKSTLDKIKVLSDTDTATKVWMDGFESPRADVAHLDIRQEEARKVILKYGNGGAGLTCLGSTNFATDFVTYKQCDYTNSPREERNPPWAGAPYGKATVCFAGCGPSAMAMIITNLTGQHVTPDMTAAYGYNTHVDGYPTGTAADDGWGGSYGNLLGPVIGEHWGVHSKPIDNFSIDEINKTLRSGGLVLAGGHMDSDTAANHGPFSTGGHFVVIRAITSDGKWLIGNSGGWPDNIQYDPQWIYSNSMTAHNAWAITRG